MDLLAGCPNIAPYMFPFSLPCLYLWLKAGCNVCSLGLQVHLADWPGSRRLSSVQFLVFGLMTFCSITSKIAFMLLHAITCYLIIYPIIHWAIPPPEEFPNPNSAAHFPGIPTGIPSRNQIALPGALRVGSGAGISDFSHLALTGGHRTDGNGRLLAETASPANPILVQTVELDKTVRSGSFTRIEHITETKNLRGTVLTDAEFLENPDAGSTVPAKNVPNTKARGAPLRRDGEQPRSTPLLARLRWCALHTCLGSPYMYIVVPSCIGCMFQRHGGGELQSSNFNYRIPPQWGPEMEHSNPPYRFRAWCMDVRLWTMLTDLDPR